MLMCLAGVSSAAGLGRQLEMRLDDIGDIDQQGRGALLAVVLDHEAQAGGRTRPHAPVRR